MSLKRGGLIEDTFSAAHLGADEKNNDLEISFVWRSTQEAEGAPLERE